MENKSIFLKSSEPKEKSQGKLEALPVKMAA